MKQRIKKASMFIGWMLLSATILPAQFVGDSIQQKVDKLFNKWEGKNNPGFMVGIVHGDSLVFSKGYGMANLEYGIEITPQTVFYMASVSKQFTGYCVTLLARQHKINIDEDIRSYLPWFPDLGKKITVKKLLNHTSGIRDDLNMIAISGLTIDGIVTNDLVIKMLMNQRSLNFSPGERYSYSNSNYILLAEVVKNVSGKTLPEFADSAIFKPLGMKNTRFQSEPSDLIKNRAVSYFSSNGKFVNAYQNVYTNGDGGMFTTMSDMAKWISNFYAPSVGDLKDIEALTKRGTLNNGKQLSYASGITVGEYKGWKIYSHAGGLHAYRTIVSIYPELKTGFIIFANTSEGSVFNSVNELADLFIRPQKKKTDSGNPIVSKSSNFSKEGNWLMKYTGFYIADEGYQLELRWTGATLLGQGFGQDFQMTQKEQNNTFLFPSKNNPQTRIVFPASSAAQEFDLVFPDESLHFTRYNTSPTVNLNDFVGRYYSRELDCTYEIVLRDQQLWLRNSKYPDSKLTVVGDSHVKRDSWFMNHLVMLKDQNKIVGFEVNSGNVMHLRFDKIEE